MNKKQQWIAYKTLLIREILRFSRIWMQTILPPVVMTILYFVIFGNLIGPRIGEMGGVSYMQYIIPGLIMMSVITNSYANVVSSFYSCKFQGNIEEMLVSPTPYYIILLSFVSGGVARGMIVGATVTLVSLVFSDFHIHHFAVIVSIIFLTAILFSLAGFTNGVFANSFDDISIVPTFVLTPLTYLGGVFYSISLLPEFWQNVSLLNPVLYMVNGFRYGILGISDISIASSYAIIIIFISILFWLNIRLLKQGKRIRR